MVRVVAGLGNPGAEYEETRHNIGYVVLDCVAGRRGALWREQRWCKASVAETNFGSAEGPRIPVWLLKPRTFMNHSGDALASFCKDRGVNPEEVLVVLDDTALELGRMRLRQSGSAGGHNGLKSIEERLGTREYPRLRCGVGSPRRGADMAGYVLDRFSAAEGPRVDDLIDRASQAIEAACTLGLTAAMNEFNRRYDTEGGNG